MTSKIAIIIPSLNSPIIDRVIHAVEQQTYVDANWEIIVVGLDAHRLIPKSNHVRFIDTGKPVLAAVARNRGIAATDADLLIFLDSDCLPTSNWLAAHVAGHQAGHQVVSGSVLPEGQNYWHLVYNLTLFHEILAFNLPGPRDFLATLNLSIDRAVIQKIGGMDETVNRVEDVEWTTRMRRAGIQPYFWPDAAVQHMHNRTKFKDVWRDCALSGYHMRQLRLLYADSLQAPGILGYPKLILLLSPFIAAWATLRIIYKRPQLISRFPLTLPTIYATKIAWCWGASQHCEPQ